MRSELRSHERQSRYSDQREELIKAHTTFVAQVAKSMIRQMGISYDMLDDFIGAGSLGLILAADRYDETVSPNFKAYAAIAIRSKIIDYLRRAHLSAIEYKRLKEMGLSRHYARDEVENVCDSSPTPELQIQRRRVAALLREVMSYLGKEEQEVLMHHYWKGKPLSELVRPGRQLPAVSKQHKKALISLRKKLAMINVDLAEWW